MTERMTEILNNLGRYVSDMQTTSPQPEEVQAMAALIRDARQAAQEQADTMTALADALAGDSGMGHNIHGEAGRMSCDECCRIAPRHGDACKTAAALRLAGRLP